jgi:hypothetical protein
MPKKQLEFERANLLPAAEFDALNRSDVLDVSPFKAQIQVTLSTTAEIDRKVLASLQKEGDALLEAAAKKTARLLQAVLRDAGEARRQEKDGAAAARKVQKLATDCAKSIEGIAEALPQEIRKALEGELKGMLKDKAGTVSTLTFLGAKEGIRVKPGAFPDGGPADDDEDDDKTVLTDAKAYQTYLRKMLKRAGTGMLNFAIGLGRKAEDSRFLFHKARPGKTLVNGIKAETGLKKFTWGVCAAHEDKPMLLVLALEGPQPPGLKKKAERLFKAFKPLPFNQVMLMVEGEEAEDVPDPEDLPEDYRELKAELYPALRDAVGAGHAAKDELLRLMGLAARAADTADFADAIALYIRMRGLLGGAAPQTGEGRASTEAEVAPRPPAPGGDPGAAFTERLKTLLPRLKSSAGTPAGDRAKLAASEAGVAARKKDFAQANTLLDEVEQLVGSAAASSATPPDDPAAAFAARLKDLLPRIKAAAGTSAGDAAKLLASEAGVDARKQEFAAALVLLERAEAALQGRGAPAADAARPTPDAAPPPGLVAKRRFLVERWRRIPPEIRAELEKLRTAIERDGPQEDAAELVGLAEEYLDDFCGAMQDAIDDDIDAGDPQYRNAIASVRAFRADIATEPLIRHLAQNANVAIETILLDALAEIEQALAA